ncbi:hypothetical protein [Mesorhizobium sp.]|uniref:hypothetical protein n=1 Tax=Mesorhizobium sp. TaxID=1871066 RepID=UPI0025F57643|nr:hypothetical protein [Mesorhizobium sp.]
MADPLAQDQHEQPSRKPASRGKPRPKRAKKSLGDDFLAAVRADFRAHGAGVIASVRADKPDQYLKIVLSVLPKDLHVDINHLDALSDDEIRHRIRGLEAVLKPFLGPFLGQGVGPGVGPGVGEQGIPQPAEGTGPAAAQ